MQDPRPLDRPHPREPVENTGEAPHPLVRAIIEEGVDEEREDTDPAYAQLVQLAWAYEEADLQVYRLMAFGEETTRRAQIERDSALRSANRYAEETWDS